MNCKECIPHNMPIPRELFHGVKQSYASCKEQLQRISFGERCALHAEKKKAQNY